MNLIDKDDLLCDMKKCKAYGELSAKSAIRKVETWQTVDAEPVRHGHWIFNPKDAIEMMFTVPKCSECGAESPIGGNYCPNCGAKMDEEK